jgi:hypothetical protein
MSLSDILPPGALTSFLASSGTTATSGASQAIDASGPSGSSEPSGPSGPVDFIALPTVISPSPGTAAVSLETMMSEIYNAVSRGYDMSGNFTDDKSGATGARRNNKTAEKLTALTTAVDTKLNHLTTSLEGLAAAVENAKKPYGPQAGGRRRSRKKPSSKRVRRKSK